MILQGDARAIPLPDNSVHCVVTSPPYWGLRDYGLGDKGIGLEPTIDLYVAHIVEVFREVWRVLRDDGTVWCNLGDSYQSGNRGQYGATRGGDSIMQRSNLGSDTIGAPNRLPQTGLKPKDLCGIPWRVAFALQADGWYLRSDIIWSKPNPMPESVTDRPTKAHEHLFLLSKSAGYFYDQEAIREPHAEPWRGKGEHESGTPHSGRLDDPDGNNQAAFTVGVREYNPLGRNARTVWEIPTEAFADAHFATFPTELARRCIAAGTSERGVCQTCGAPWEREVEPTPEYAETLKRAGSHWYPTVNTTEIRADGLKHGNKESGCAEYQTIGWQPSCSCPEADAVSALVLDPFGGSGTVAATTFLMGRRAISLDLSFAYCQMAMRRIPPLARMTGMIAV